MEHNICEQCHLKLGARALRGAQGKTTTSWSVKYYSYAQKEACSCRNDLSIRSIFGILLGRATQALESVAVKLYIFGERERERLKDYGLMAVSNV